MFPFLKPAVVLIFLSTPSARRATEVVVTGLCLQGISIHALREEGDQTRVNNQHRKILFLSTPSARRATFTGSAHSEFCIQFLSTPSARRATERRTAEWTMRANFYPRPPRGGRHEKTGLFENEKEFLSTPSARRATAKTETKSLFSNKLYNILHEFRRALIYNGSKNYPNHAK